MTKAFWKVIGPSEMCPGSKALMPSDNQTAKALHQYARGDIITTTKPRKPRHAKHHRKFFAMLNLVWNGTGLQDRFPNMDCLLDALKHEIGHVETFMTIHGEALLKPKSIAFESMAQDEFQAFYDQAVEIIATRLVPHLDKKDLERQINEMIN